MNRNEPCEAGILSVWKDLLCYRRFMQHQHDEIFAKSDQGSNVYKYFCRYIREVSNIGTTDITGFVDKGKLLRVAECSVENVKRARFEQVLKDAGNRGMKPGMLKGAFGKRQNGKYLTASLWDNEDSHQRYADKELPALINESGVKDSTQRISVSLIELHPKWAVI